MSDSIHHMYEADILLAAIERAQWQVTRDTEDGQWVVESAEGHFRAESLVRALRKAYRAAGAT